MKKTIAFASFIYTLLVSNSSFALTTLTVNLPGDLNPMTGGTWSDGSGDFRGALNYANQTPTDSYLINFNLASVDSTIFIQGLLPLLNLKNNNPAHPLTIDGTNGGNTITIDGQSLQRGFFARSGKVEIDNMNINNVVAVGGNGGGGGGPGGRRSGRRGRALYRFCDCHSQQC